MIELNPIRLMAPDGSMFPPERELDITASVCGALFGENDYTSEWALWQRHATGALNKKAGKLARFGNALERGIATLLETEEGVVIEKEHGYYRDEQHRIGASLDYWCYRWGDREFGDGIPLDIKLVSQHAWRSKWDEGDIVPNQYALQIQMQCALTGAARGLLGLLIAGETTKIIEVPFSVPLFEALSERVEAFWLSVKERREPLADPKEDGPDMLRRFRRTLPNTSMDLSKDNEAHELVARYMQLTAENKIGAKIARDTDNERSAVKAALFQKMKETATATVGRFVIETETTSRKGYTVQASELRKITITE